MSDMAPMNEAPAAVGSKKLSKAKIFRNAITFSKLHYTDDVEVQYPIDAVEFLSVKQFDAEYVQQHLEHIRHLIDIENTELERAIDDLQKIINGEDIHSEEVTPRGSRDHAITTAFSSTLTSTSSSSAAPLAKASRPIPDVRFSQTLNSATLLKAKDNSSNSRSHSSSHSSHSNHHPSQSKITKTTAASSSSSSSSSAGMHRSSSVPNDVSFFVDLDDSSVRPLSQPTFNSNQTKSAESSPQQPQQQQQSSRVSKFRGRLRDAQAELFLADDL